MHPDNIGQQFTHPLYEGGDQPMYRWMHHEEYDEAQETGSFKLNRNSSPTPQDAYATQHSVLVKFNSAPGRFRKKDLEGRQANFYVNPHGAIPFSEATVVKTGHPDLDKKYGVN